MKKATITLNVTMVFFMALTSCKKETGNNNNADPTPNPITEVKIGNQTWMDKNLSVVKFKNGDNIPQAKSAKEWAKFDTLKTGAWCYYNFDSTNNAKHGKLYNWYAVSDARGLAPSGWHVPNNAEWNVLRTFLGGEFESGDDLKSKDGWLNNGNGTNASGFNMNASGFCNHTGGSNQIGNYAFLWSAESYDAKNAHYYTLFSGSKTFYASTTLKGCGTSIRCIKD
jgi:uncharacterized protein (TIGR02145 family)